MSPGQALLVVAEEFDVEQIGVATHKCVWGWGTFPWAFDDPWVCPRMARQVIMYCDPLGILAGEKPWPVRVCTRHAERLVKLIDPRIGGNG